MPLKHLKVIMSKIELVMIPPNLLFAILVRDPSIQAEDWEVSVTPFYLILFPFLICHQDRLISIYKLNLKFTCFPFPFSCPDYCRGTQAGRLGFSLVPAQAILLIAAKWISLEPFGGFPSL